MTWEVEKRATFQQSIRSCQMTNANVEERRCSPFVCLFVCLFVTLFVLFVCLFGLFYFVTLLVCFTLLLCLFVWWTLMGLDGLWWTLMDFDGLWWTLMDFDELWWIVVMYLDFAFFLGFAEPGQKTRPPFFSKIKCKRSVYYVYVVTIILI